tara:strand:- start:3137 stop:3733 length:597 start_codon:yes stop_codon:yes gene_type:complete
MEPIDVYLMYCAMKAHFSKGEYDFVKYGGKSKVSRDSFWKRSDRSFFAKLSRKYENENDIRDYFVANFTINNERWVGNFTDEIYSQWKNKMETLSQNFENEMTPLLENFEEGKYIFAVSNGNHPKLFKEYLGKRVSIETMIILDELMEYSKKWDVQMDGDHMWLDAKNLMDNYKKFLTFNVEECKMLLLKFVKGNEDD